MGICPQSWKLGCWPRLQRCAAWAFPWKITPVQSASFTSMPFVNNPTETLARRRRSQCVPNKGRGMLAQWLPGVSTDLDFLSRPRQRTSMPLPLRPSSMPHTLSKDMSSLSWTHWQHERTHSLSQLYAKSISSSPGLRWGPIWGKPWTYCFSHKTGKITIFNREINYKWAIFNSYFKLPEGNQQQSCFQ